MDSLRVPSRALLIISAEDSELLIRRADQIQDPGLTPVYFRKWEIGLRQEILRGRRHEAREKLVAEALESVDEEIAHAQQGGLGLIGGNS